jgi:hypothetical protein
MSSSKATSGSPMMQHWLSETAKDEPWHMLGLNEKSKKGE